MTQKPCEHCSVLWASHWLMTVDAQVVDPKNVKPQIPHLRTRDPRGLLKGPFFIGVIRNQPSHSSSSNAFCNILSLCSNTFSILMKTIWKLCEDPHPSLSFILKWKLSPQKVSWWRWMDVFYKMSVAAQKHIPARAAPKNTKLVFFYERLIPIFECMQIFCDPWTSTRIHV